MLADDSERWQELLKVDFVARPVLLRKVIDTHLLRICWLEPPSVELYGSEDDEESLHQQGHATADLRSITRCASILEKLRRAEPILILDECSD